MIRFHAATALLQWATGGMFFCWFTTRRRAVGLGYGWMLRCIFFIFAFGAFISGLAFGINTVREVASFVVALSCLTALWMSIKRKSAGVGGRHAEFKRRSERVAAMTGIERTDPFRRGSVADDAKDPDVIAGTMLREYNPQWDLVPAMIGMIGLIVAAIDAGGNTAVALLRTLVGAAFIGAISDSMLLGHWYLVQPGLPRKLLNEIVTALIWIWPLEVAVLLLPTGMISVFIGDVDDGWGGMLGWMWLACALTTIVLVFVTRIALKERYYSAVMAATGLLYLAILTAFGTDFVARAVLDRT